MSDTYIISVSHLSVPQAAKVRPPALFLNKLLRRLQKLPATPMAAVSQLTYSSSRSSLTLWSTSMIFEPASNYITSPDVIIGLIPNSMQVPRYDARYTLTEYKGSAPVGVLMP